MKELQHLTTLFDLRDAERRVYEKLFLEGDSGAGDLAKKVGVSRPAIYDLTEKLIRKGLVVQTIRGGVKVFSVQQLGHVEKMLAEKQEQLDQSKKSLENLRQTELQLRQTFGPRLQLFEGREALQQMIKDVLLYRDMELRAYWPIMDVMKLLTPEFFKDYDKKRQKLNISVKGIWPHDRYPSLKTHPSLYPGKAFKREIRLAPPGADFTLGYTIYGNTVRFISSSKENFGFIVESYELVKTMQNQFDFMWKHCKPVPMPKK